MEYFYGTWIYALCVSFSKCRLQEQRQQPLTWRSTFVNFTLSNRLLIPRAGSSSSGSGSDRMSVDGGHSEEDGVGGGRGRSARGAPTLNARELGAPDCTLVGAAWRIAVHRCAH